MELLARAGKVTVKYYDETASQWEQVVCILIHGHSSAQAAFQQAASVAVATTELASIL